MADSTNTPDDNAPVRDVTGHPTLKWRMPDGLWLTDQEAAALMSYAEAVPRG